MGKPKKKYSIAGRLLGFVARFIEIIVRLAFLLVSVAIVFGVAYFLGHVFFQGLRGNDTFNALNNVHWIDRFFPKIPYWYPLQGGGVSIKWGYPLGSSVLPILVNRILNVGLVRTFQLQVGFWLP